MSDLEPGWLNQTRYDGVSYTITAPHRGVRFFPNISTHQVTTITIQTPEGSVMSGEISPVGTSFYNNLVDKWLPPLGWRYLGETDYTCDWIHNQGGVFQHAIGGSVLSLTHEIPQTNCVATAMQWLQNQGHKS